MQKITPFLWFDAQAEEAANYYVSIFKNSGIGKIARYDAASAQASGKPAGSVMTVAFKLNGQDFTALNGGAAFKFNESISFVVNCDTQDEIDYLWEKLTAGGTPVQCGWLKDKYGVSWQIVPANLDDLVCGSDPVKSQRAMAEMIKMVKLDIARLRRAYEG